MKKTIVSSLLVLLMLSMTACSSTVIESDSSGESSLSIDEIPTELEDSMVEEPTENKNTIVSGQYVIGDIILADGSIEKVTNFTET